jgi:hypothetical protein
MHHCRPTFLAGSRSSRTRSYTYLVVNCSSRAASLTLIVFFIAHYPVSRKMFLLVFLLFARVVGAVNTPMEHSQKIRFFAPQYILKAFDVEQRLFDGRSDKRNLVFRGELEGAGIGEPLKDTAIEEFANCLPDINAIKKFTQRFGPLWTTTSGKEFGFQLEDWIRARQQFRMTWDHMLGLAQREQDIGLVPPEVEELLRREVEPCRKVETQGTFQLTNAGMVYVADSLYAALVLKLFALQGGKKLRRCLKPECDNQPYFIATHGRQQYCSDRCAEWAQAQFKKEWWKKQGSLWLREKSSATKTKARKERESKGRKRGKKNGTQETG